MSRRNRVWVRWKNSTSNEWLFDKVNELNDDADISDLRRAFVMQHEPDVRRPATVKVRETEDGEVLKASTKLNNYFVPPPGVAAAAGPGRSEDTALFFALDESPPSPKKPKTLPRRYIKGVDPSDPLTLQRKELVEEILGKLSQLPFVIMKGPAAVGKSSVMNLLEHYCATNSALPNGSACPKTHYTFMERDAFSPMDQLNDAVLKLGDWDEGGPERILCCDDIQNVPATFWETLQNSDFFRENHVRILAATTRRCASDPASPSFPDESVVSYSMLRFQQQELEAYAARFLEYKTNLKEFSVSDLSMIIAATLEQSGGHVFAFVATLDTLDHFCSIRANRNLTKSLSYLLSRSFLDQAYTRIWPYSTADSFSQEQRLVLQDAMIDEDAKLSVDLQTTLMKMFFIQDTNQTLADRSWHEVKSEATFNLATRRLYSFMFDTRGDENFVSKGIADLVQQTLASFKRVDLQQAKCATDVGFPKEGALQQMFFAALTRILPAKTEVVAEMSAILPDRGDKERGELDFYVNSYYYYGIELMREGGNFKEHKERFSEPLEDNPNRGKYFTPLIKEFIIVDFRRHGFMARDKDEFRLIVKFDAEFSSCSLERAGKDLGTIQFL